MSNSLLDSIYGQFSYSGQNFYRLKNGSETASANTLFNCTVNRDRMLGGDGSSWIQDCGAWG